MSPSTPTFPNILIRASAGTGKTFQLSNRFIGLAAAGEPLDTILATTFTRKGAGEILDRVLSRLAAAASDPREAAELADRVGNPALDRDRCLGLLREMVCSLHRLRVGTLDSFFIQMARSFSLELGLPPGWRIVDEITDARLRAEAVRGVLEGESATGAVRLMNLLAKGEATRSVAEQIGALVRDLYSVYLETEAEAWQSLRRPKPLEPAELAAALDGLAAVALPQGKSFANARQQDLANAQQEDWGTFLSKGIAKKILEREATFGRKPIPAEVAAAYEPVVRHARAVLLGRIANQTEATGRLLGQFHVAYQRLKRARQAMRFEDVTWCLADGRLEDRIDQVDHRLDARLAHLLLDEFQDTDPLQWRAVRPLAWRVVSEGRRHSFFCVGDVKQAIFGWRGGVAEIFDTLAEGPWPLQTRPLNTSHRSAQPVIDTVNRVFERLADNAALRNYADARDRWARRFQHHTTARTELAGYCRMIAAPEAGEGRKPLEVTLGFAADQIARRHREMPGVTIGVLVRTNAAVARLIYELRQRDIEASEEGGNPLTDSPAVQVVLSLLTLADHPGDAAARFHVAHSPLAGPLGLTRHDDAAAAVRLARRVRRGLMEDGYGPTILGWVEILGASCDARDLSRLAQLVELVYGYEASATTRCDDFIRVVSEQRVEAATAAAIRVMTLHKAKGLQFDVVVLPELDARLLGRPPEVVVGRPHPTAPIEHVCRYVSQQEQAILPERFQESFREDQARRVEESLCVLYVGLTRPVHALELIVPPSKPNEKHVPGTLAGVLRAGLTDGKPAAAGRVLYQHGDPEWFRSAAQKVRGAAPAKPPEPLAVKLAPAPKHPTRGLDFRSPSQLEGGPRVNLAARLRLGAAGALERGSLVHAWFEQIAWLDDGPPGDDLLRQAAEGLDTAGLDVPALVRKFHQALARPEISSLLRQATYRRAAATTAGCGARARSGLAEPRWEVRREHAFAVRDGDAILRGAIDRLVVLYDGDKTIGADVVDFKTDRIEAGDAGALSARVEQYRPQLEAYHRAAAKLLGLDPQCVSARLAFVEPGIIRTVVAASK